MDMQSKVEAATDERIAPPSGTLQAIPDDKAMLRAARDETKDLQHARPDIYWPDMLFSAGLGYGTMAGAIVTALAGNVWLAIGLGIVSALAMYRALLFIHELTHIHKNALPGFRLAWNLLVGIPLLTPSFMYEGVHNLHHARTRYGTDEDPEYLPLARMKPWTLPVFVIIAVLAPLAVLIRSALLIPIGVVFPAVHKLVWERASALAINPDFRRRPPEGEIAARVRWQEPLAVVWAWVVIGSIFVIGWQPLVIALVILSLTTLLNQLRTLVAHLWENNGEPMSVTAQYLDSVNVPPPGILAALWAPVGLRYHALHHLLPSMPYHSMGEAHRRLSRSLGDGSTYAAANHSGMLALIRRIANSTMRRGKS